MFLATTALSEFWKKDRDIMFLGEWCLLYDRRKEWENLHYKTMDYPWDDSIAFYKAKEYCDQIYEYLLTNLTVCLNAIHNVKYSQRYWRIILGPWLMYYIQPLYDRYVCLKNAFEQYPNLETMCLSEKSYITPIDLMSFKFLSVNDPYNLQLYSQLIKLMGYTMPEQDYAVNIVTTQVVHGQGQSKFACPKKIAKNTLRKFPPFFNKIGGRLSSKLMGQMSIRTLDSLKICLKSGLRVWPIFPIELNISQLSINHKLRRGLLDICKNDISDPFLKIIIQTLPCNFPIAYMEGYSTIRKYVSKCFVHSTRAIIDACGWFINEPFKVLAAEKAETGSLLVHAQHGGLEGIGKICPGEPHEIALSDYFFSWGWKKQGCHKVKPMPYARISLLQKKETSQKYYGNGPILHISSVFPRYLQLFQTVPVGPQVLRYFDEQFSFIKNLPPRMRQMLIIRPYPFHEYGWQQYQRFKDLFPDNTIDYYNRPIHEKFQECRLVICSDLQTTFLEAMAYNIPTLLFISAALWEIRDEAIPYFQELERAGILLYKEEDAVIKVEEIFDNPAIWWFSNEVQSIRKRFMNNFAFGSDNWLKIWVDELVHL
jgi:putative transferase (TIGR04331 family)